MRRRSVVPEMTDLEKSCLALIKPRGAGRPIPHREIAAQLAAEPRRVRKAVQRLVKIHHQPICSKYDASNPGYYWPQTREEVRDSSQRLLRHGVNIIMRARAIAKWSDEEVLGQMRIELENREENS